MRTLFYLSESQMERISPFFPRSHGIPRADDRHVARGGVCHAADTLQRHSLRYQTWTSVKGCSRGIWSVQDAVQSVRQVEQARCFQQDLHRVGKPDAL